jgi:hypothetical protein
MPILTLQCPDCGHVFQGAVLLGTRPTEVWVCSQCLGRGALQMESAAESPHPWEAGRAGCSCCG